jgi:uncharacterized protein involved in exopolysaccharide biosynthesis
VTQTKVLETEVSELKKQVTAAVKSSASLANKADVARKQSDTLVKRIAKLEAK